MPQTRQFLGLSSLQLFTILGVLGAAPAIAIPLMTCGPAPSPEGQRTVGAMNRAQQAYLLEKNSFAKSVSDLSQSMPTRTRRYDYSTQTTARTAFNYGIARVPNSYSYVGGVFQVARPMVESKTAGYEITTVTIVCQTEKPGQIRPAQPMFLNGKPTCAPGTMNVSNPIRSGSPGKVLPASNS